MKELLGDKPLVWDREFSYLELLEALVVEEVNFVIRLKRGAHFFDEEGKQIALSIDGCIRHTIQIALKHRQCGKLTK